MGIDNDPRLGEKRIYIVRTGNDIENTQLFVDQEKLGKVIKKLEKPTTATPPKPTS